MTPMLKKIDYCLTPTSPWTYLGHGRLADIAKRHGAADFLRAVWAEERNVAEIGMLAEIAARHGIADAPGDELFWGQDRLDFLDRALAR